MRLKPLRAVNGQKTTTSIGVFKCPHCGVERETIVGGREGPFKCMKCHQIMAKDDEELKKIIIERQVDGFICPECKETVSDTSANWPIAGWGTMDGENAVICPNCLIVLNGLPLIHHGNLTEEFEPLYRGTDYFEFRHSPCRDKEHGGFCTIYAVLMDNQGRVIFNLECMDCGEIDALKTHTYFLAKDKAPRGKEHTIEAIYLSPKLRKRIGKHSWDDL